MFRRKRDESIQPERKPLPMPPTSPYRLARLVALIIALLLLGAAGSHAESSVARDNYLAASRDIAAQLAKAVPVDLAVESLAVAPIEGDDGALADLVAAALNQGTVHRLIERADLLQLLAEQRIQLRDIIDPNATVAAGRIQGVEGLLLGRITQRSCNFLYCRMEVFFKLDNVERGDVVFARAFGANYVPPTTVALAIGLVVAICGSLLLRWLRDANRRKRGKRVNADDQRLLTLQDTLRQIRDRLARSHDELVARNDMDAGVAVREAGRQARELLARIEQAPGMHIEGADPAAAKGARQVGESLASTLARAAAASQDLARAVAGSESAEMLARKIAEVKQSLAEAGDCLHQRRVGRA